MKQENVSWNVFLSDLVGWQVAFSPTLAAAESPSKAELETIVRS